MNKISALVARQPTMIILMACILVSAAANKEFLTGANFYNLLRQIAPSGIVALGMAVVIIAAGIDLSVGAMAALAGVIVLTLQPLAGSAAGIAMALAAGAAAGLANGTAVTWLRINPFMTRWHYDGAQGSVSDHLRQPDDHRREFLVWPAHRLSRPGDSGLPQFCSPRSSLS